MLAYTTFSLLIPTNYCVFVVIFALYLPFGVFCDLCADQFNITAQIACGESSLVHPFHTLILLQAPFNNLGFILLNGKGEF